MSEDSKKNKKETPPKPEMPVPGGNNKPFKFGFNWVYALVFFVLIFYFFSSTTAERNKEVGWTEFRHLAENNTFSKMQVNMTENKVIATVKKENLITIFGTDSLPAPGPFSMQSNDATVSVIIPSADKFSDYYDRWVNEYKIDSTISYSEGNSRLWSLIINIVPFAILIFVWVWLLRKSTGGVGGPFGVGRTKAQLYDKTTQAKKVTFKDVAGLAEAKQEVEEIVDFLKNPKKYTDLGAKIPKGALLVGPPGTGKTLLAKAVAGEANVPFFSLSGSDFVEMFVGVGASRVRDLFRQAKEKAPCIIFIDEIDAVGRARNRNPNFGANDERESTLNQLLTEMDGFASNSGVIILAATNRVDILDKALLRAGRFDRQINVDLPELNERKEIFNVHLKNIKLGQDVNTEFLARQTPGFSGADIANVCNEAALIAARNGKEAVQKDDFMNAVDRIVGGLEKKSKVTTEGERKTIAIHEAGHATLSWMLEHANPLVKVTIVPRGKALGAAWYMPEERQITTYEQLQDELCATLGGRAAEDIVTGKISTGAANDLEKVTKQAYAMVAYYGMSPNLQNLNYYDASGQDWGFTKPYSDQTAKLIDDEVKRIINEQYERAKRILRENKDKHSELASFLLEKEVIYADDLERIFGERKWVSRSQEILAEQGLANEETAHELSENQENKEENK